MTTEPYETGRVFVGGINKLSSKESVMNCFNRYGAVRDLFYPFDR
jgi:hypothetical protein